MEANASVYVNLVNPKNILTKHSSNSIPEI